jgi:hypothetical protein
MLMLIQQMLNVGVCVLHDIKNPTNRDKAQKPPRRFVRVLVIVQSTLIKIKL